MPIEITSDDKVIIANHTDVDRNESHLIRTTLVIEQQQVLFSSSRLISEDNRTRQNI